MPCLHFAQALLSCTAFLASAITIIANQRGWGYSPCVLLCRRHIPKLVREKVWGSAENRGTAKQNSQRGLRRGRMESGGPLCHPGLVGASGAIWTPAYVYPHISPFFILFKPPTPTWQDSPREWVMAGVTWTTPPLSLRGISSCLPSFAIYSFSSSSQTTFSCSSFTLSPLWILSAPFGGIWGTVRKPGKRQLPPILCSHPSSPPSLCLCGLFSCRTPAVSWNYRFAGLLLTWSWTQHFEASSFCPSEGAKLMESREKESCLEQCSARQTAFSVPLPAN